MKKRLNVFSFFIQRSYCHIDHTGFRHLIRHPAERPLNFSVDAVSWVTETRLLFIGRIISRSCNYCSLTL